MNQPTKAVFLDKDGTLIKDCPYNVNPAFIEWEKGVLDGLRLLQNQGFVLVIITNQPGVALGRFSMQELLTLKTYFVQFLAQKGIRLSGFYFCPHQATTPPLCECRKPSPQLIRQAAQALHIDLGASWMIGDILNDVEAGNRAGCQTILIDNGNETEWLQAPQRTPTFKAADFREAVQYICTFNHPYSV